MSRRARTRYLGVLKGDDAPLLCATWAAGPRSRQEETGHILFGKALGVTGKNGSLELARYEFKKDFLSEAILNMEEDDLPRCIAIHPGGDGVVCSFSKSCKLYELDISGGIKLTVSERDIAAFEDVGPQNCLLFSADGSRLAAGGKDGHLRVFEWPSLKVILDQEEGCKSIKDLDLSLDGAFLASLTDDGNTCRVWDLSKSLVVTTISHDKGEYFGFCRFSRDGTKPFLFVTTTKAKNASIAVWEMDSWSKVGAKKFLENPITSFAISQNGKHVAIGSSEGDVHIIEVKKMAFVEQVRSAHLSKVIALEFSPNCRALLSLSVDSTARVTALNLEKEWKEWQIYLLLALMIIASAALFYLFFEHSDSFWKFPLGRNQPAKPSIEAIYGSHVNSGDSDAS